MEYVTIYLWESILIKINIQEASSDIKFNPERDLIVSLPKILKADKGYIVSNKLKYFSYGIEPQTDLENIIMISMDIKIGIDKYIDKNESVKPILENYPLIKSDLEEAEILQEHFTESDLEYRGKPDFK